ncbi:MAG: BA14K family protein [Hyphomicrobiales bacterium]
MTSNLKKAVIATLTAAAMSMGATAANAVGGVNALASFESGKSIEQVQSRGRGFRGRGFSRGGRGFSRGRGFSSRGRGFRGRNIGLGIGAGILTGVVVGSAIKSGRRHHGHSGNLALRKHVAWCAKRYKTYNARTDTFISYKHGKKRCNSPFT